MKLQESPVFFLYFFFFLFEGARYVNAHTYRIDPVETLIYIFALFPSK